MPSSLQWVDDFTGLFFPRICPGCSSSLYKQETLICTNCRYYLPRTRFHQWRNNPVEMIFWGRVRIEYATAGFYFQKKGRLQKIIHQFKYRGGREIGQELGKLMGQELRGTAFEEVTKVVAVPLHPSKQKLRGYNQSEYLAKGIAEGLERPVDFHSLQRVVASSTQTRKNRFERWQNVEEIFRVENAASLEQHHILLVDDVITTGATLEACASAVLKVPGARVSIATLAMA